MAQDETYQTAVYMERGGNQLVAKSGGTLALLSGAGISAISGANWGLAGANVATDDMRRILVSEQTVQLITPVAGSVVLPTVNLPKNVRVVKILGSATVVSASFWLTSVSAGREVHLHLCGDASGTFTNASTQVDVSLSGCILLGSVGAAISGFEMHTSVASDCGVHLVAVADNTWSIVGQFGDIDE
jgi:hypothetical protein